MSVFTHLKTKLRTYIIFFLSVPQLFVTYSLNCMMELQLPTERTIVCEDANRNSWIFALFQFCLHYQFFQTISVCKNRFDFYISKKISNLFFLYYNNFAFSKIFPISFLKQSKDPGMIKFTCSKESSSWKRE